MATVVTSLRIPADLSERYNRLAEETGRSRSYYVNEALADSIDRFEYEYGILKDVEDYRAGRLKTYSLAEVGEMLGLDDCSLREGRAGAAEDGQADCPPHQGRAGRDSEARRPQEQGKGPGGQPRGALALLGRGLPDHLRHRGWQARHPCGRCGTQARGLQAQVNSYLIEG